MSQHIGYVPSATGITQTVNVQTNTVASIDVTTFAGFNANNCAFAVTAFVLGRSTGGNAVWYEIYGLFKRNSGTLSQVGTTQLMKSIADAALNSTSYVLDATGTTIRVRAVGINTATIDWTGGLSVSSSPF